jgi:sigma-B regulation protein RsbU (phosphoserine phosphatase)
MGNEVSRLPLKPILAAGSLEFTSYTAMETTLLPQTTLFLFTDGLTEAKNTEKLMFGDDHTLQVATRLQQEQLLEPKQVVTSMNDAVKAFVGEAEQSDDLTMLAIQYKGSEKIVDTMKLDVSIDEMPRVSDFVISQAKRSGMDEERTSDLRMAVEEAVANIVNYSGASDIILGATEQDGKLCMVLSDDGSSFDPTAMPPPDFTLPGEKRLVGGLGIHYMRQMSDSLAYRREADRNILTIIKNIL